MVYTALCIETYSFWHCSANASTTLYPHVNYNMSWNIRFKIHSVNGFILFVFYFSLLFVWKIRHQISSFALIASKQRQNTKRNNSAALISLATSKHFNLAHKCLSPLNWMYNFCACKFKWCDATKDALYDLHGVKFNVPLLLFFLSFGTFVHFCIILNKFSTYKALFRALCSSLNTKNKKKEKNGERINYCIESSAHSRFIASTYAVRHG